MTTLRVNEIFNSIAGEGPQTGAPTTFIRLQGCDLRCGYCDTTYAQDPKGGTEMEVWEIAKGVRMPNVCITGGEPFIQREGLIELIAYLESHIPLRIIEIETNGMHELFSTLHYVQRVRYLCDLKLPSSGTTMSVDWIERLLDSLRTIDSLMCIAGSEADLLWLKGVLSNIDRVLFKPQVFVHPVFKMLDPKRIVEWLVENADLFYGRGIKVRVGIQIHKVIWPINQRGV